MQYSLAQLTSWIGLGLSLPALLASGLSAAVPARPVDPNRVHDPSTIVKCKNEYWLFATGQGIVSRRSTNQVDWQSGPKVFAQLPEWRNQIVPDQRGYFWAPDVIYHNQQYLLYYSVSAWGKNTSAIGLAVNSTLDPADPSYHWTDRGPVIASGKNDNFNAIDPSVFKDEDGKLWLSFGSFWTGIKLIELDPATGHRIAPDSPIYSLARHSSIEAPCLSRHGQYYYLFVNWGLCCRGTNSTYEIRFGRSIQVAGPYLDQDGREMLQGGGTLLLGSQANFIGPGHPAIFSKKETDWLSYHYYDALQAGRPRLALKKIRWTMDGWPSLKE